MTGQEIADAVDKIIAEIDPRDGNDWGAVNWGDLGCCEVCEVHSLWPSEETRIEVLVEEADPSSWKLGGYISERFLELHGIVIDVRTEW